VQQIQPADTDWFLEWQRGVAAAAESFPGYKDTDVFPPDDGQRNEWVVVIHFEDDKSLREWLDSPIRAQWVAKLRARVGRFELKALSGGFAPWFASLTRQRDASSPPSWKMALTVLLGLYPTVMLLALFPGPYLNPLGFALAMLISNALSISLLEWAVMPVLTTVLDRWLKANEAKQRPVSIGGLLVIICLLGSLVILFRLARIGES
jgi:antibiotic biosynthesis monooxygenase (ABM) superfamily enzyme